MYFNKVQEKIFVTHNIFFKDSYFSHKLCSSENLTLYEDDFSFFKKSFLYIITETVAEYPYPYFTEKTWKAMLLQKPFLMVNSQHSLKKLKDFGFKTFDEFWDEGYDDLEYAADRIDKITEIVSDLSNLTANEIDTLYKKMLPLLEHNQQQVKTLYFDQQNDIKEKLKNL